MGMISKFKTRLGAGIWLFAFGSFSLKPEVAFASLVVASAIMPFLQLPFFSRKNAATGLTTSTCSVLFLDQTKHRLEYDARTTVRDAVKQLAGLVKLLHHHACFALYESKQKVAMTDSNQESTLAEHILLDENRYITDILQQLSEHSEQNDVESQLLFKFRVFRYGDEDIKEPQFIKQLYMQAQYDYLACHYPGTSKCTAQLCALQMQAEHGTLVEEDAQGVSNAMLKYVPTIKGGSVQQRQKIGLHLDIATRYSKIAKERVSQHEARMQFLKIIQGLTYGNSVFYAVKRAEEPTGLLPSQLVLAINRHGVHFFKTSPLEHLRSLEIRNVMQFGSTSQELRLRAGTAKGLFRLKTQQAEEICRALQVYVSDSLVKGKEESSVLERGFLPNNKGARTANGTIQILETQASDLQCLLDKTMSRAAKAERIAREHEQKCSSLEADLKAAQANALAHQNDHVGCEAKIAKLEGELKHQVANLREVFHGQKAAKTMVHNTMERAKARVEAAEAARMSYEEELARLTKELVETKKALLERDTADFIDFPSFPRAPGDSARDVNGNSNGARSGHSNGLLLGACLTR